MRETEGKKKLKRGEESHSGKLLELHILIPSALQGKINVFQGGDVHEKYIEEH